VVSTQSKQGTSKNFFFFFFFLFCVVFVILGRGLNQRRARNGALD
jgi:hypothetical protein